MGKLWDFFRKKKTEGTSQEEQIVEKVPQEEQEVVWAPQEETKVEAAPQEEVKAEASPQEGQPSEASQSQQPIRHYYTPSTDLPKPTQPTKEEEYDVVIPSEKGDATLAHQYSIHMPESNIDIAWKAAEEKRWYLTASIVDGNIHLFSGDDDIGILNERANMMKDWLRRGDPYLIILENVNSETGCTVRLVFYRDQKKQYANCEQSVVALVSYKSEAKQDNQAGMMDGEEVEARRNYKKDNCVVISAAFGPIGNLPKMYAKRYIEEGAALVVLDHCEVDDDYKDKPFVRIYWKPRKRVVKTDRQKENTVSALPFDFTVFDVETTGLKPNSDHIIEISALRYRNGAPTESFSTLVCPPLTESYCLRDGEWGLHSYYIPPEITKLTGITDDMVKEMPRIEEVLPKFIQFIGEDILVGHNVKFDVNFILAAGVELLNPLIDTMRIARRAFPELAHHRLQDVVKACGVSNDKAHRALSDCRATGDSFLVMREMLLHSDPKTGVVSDQPRKRAYKNQHGPKPRDIQPTVDYIDPDGALFGKSIVFTGELTISRAEAMQLAVNAGAVVKTSVSRKTNYLVVGKQDKSLVGEDGMSTKEENAYAINEQGKAHIEIIGEDEFIKLAKGEVVANV